MDLSISPDLDARLCYSVVLLCGLFSARTQIYKRFVVLKMNITEVWLVPTTWMMFGIYLLTPLGLFWLMDRTGALNDTSLLAALLVGLAYPAILEGGFGGLKVPSGLGDVVKPVQAFTDKMIESVNQAVARHQRKFEDFVVNRTVTDPKVFDELFGLTRTSTPVAGPASGNPRFKITYRVTPGTATRSIAIPHWANSRGALCPFRFLRPARLTAIFTRPQATGPLISISSRKRSKDSTMLPSVSLGLTPAHPALPAALAGPEAS